MSNLGNSNPKVIAAAFAAAAVIGAGAVFIMNGNLSSVLPGTNVKDEAKPPVSSGSVAPKKDDKLAEALQAIVALAKNHDAEGFKARVDTESAAVRIADAIKAAYPGAAKNNSDENLKKQALAGINDALTGKIKEKGYEESHNAGAFTVFALDFPNVTFDGVAETNENNGLANVSVNLKSDESLPDGFVLSIVMRQNSETGQWNIASVTNAEDYAIAVRDGRLAIAKRCVQEARGFIKQYNEAIAALNAKHPVLSKEYADGYEAAEKALMDGIATLKPTGEMKMFITSYKHRDERVTEHIRLIRAYAAGDRSEENKRKRREMEEQMGQINRVITSIIKSNTHENADTGKDLAVNSVSG